MVKQARRTDRCFRVRPATGGRFSAQRAPPPPQQVSGWEASDCWQCCSSATEMKKEAGGPGSDGGSAEPQLKRGRQEGNQDAAALANRDKVPGSCDPSEAVPGADQQGAAEVTEDSRTAQLQSVGSLKVTIQQSSESREFGSSERTSDRQAGGLHCHVCSLTCRSLQVFKEHMSGQEHLRKLQEVIHSIRLNSHPLLDRGRRPHAQRWCDTCQVHFTGDVIVHRRTKQHKVCKQLGRPFCPVCKRHFRTPRKFVEHMKSAEHKEQVHLEEAQEEELITVDAVGCFEGEEVDEEVEVADEEERKVSEGAESKEAEEEEQEDSLHQTFGSGFVVPVRGFVCRLCKKFFSREPAARHTHCMNLQNLRAQQRKQEGEDKAEDRTASTRPHNASVHPGDAPMMMSHRENT